MKNEKQNNNIEKVKTGVSVVRCILSIIGLIFGGLVLFAFLRACIPVGTAIQSFFGGG